MRTFFTGIALIVVVFVAAGCGDQKKPSAPLDKAKDSTSARVNMPVSGNNPAPEQSKSQLVARKDFEVQEGAAGEAERQAEGGAAPAQPVARKIIYNAVVKMVVEDLPKAEESLKQLLKKHDGFVAQSELSGSTGSRRSGHWRLRIPVDGFDDFLTELVKLGVPEMNKTDSQDVTDQFYDLEARIKNRKSEEESLRKLLEKTTGKMEDILAVRRELNQVRSDIDQKEGQLRRLANLSSLTTVNVTFQEIKDYVPPQSPTFGGNIAGTFSGSIDALQSVGKGLVLIVVAVTPWLPIVLLIAIPIWVLLRRRRSSTAQPVVPSTTAPSAG